MKLNNEKETKSHLLDMEREKDQRLTSSMDNEATMKWNTIAKSLEELLLSNPTSKTHKW